MVALIHIRFSKGHLGPFKFIHHRRRGARSAPISLSLCARVSIEDLKQTDAPASRAYPTNVVYPCRYKIDTFEFLIQHPARQFLPLKEVTRRRQPRLNQNGAADVDSGASSGSLEPHGAGIRVDCASNSSFKSANEALGSKRFGHD